MTLVTDVLTGFYFYLLPLTVYGLCGFITYIYAGYRMFRGGSRDKEDTDNDFFYGRLKKSVVSPAAWVYVILWLSACGCFTYANWRLWFLAPVLATDLGLAASWVGLGHIVLTISSTLAIFYFENLTVGLICYTLFTLGPLVTQMGLAIKLHIDAVAGLVGTVTELWAPIFTLAWASFVAVLGLVYIIILIGKNMNVACGEDKYESVESNE
jgi:hypothetical protein